MCLNICSLKCLAAKIAKFQVGIRNYRGNVCAPGSLFFKLDVLLL